MNTKRHQNLTLRHSMALLNALAFGRTGTIRYKTPYFKHYYLQSRMYHLAIWVLTFNISPMFCMFPVEIIKISLPMLSIKARALAILIGSALGLSELQFCDPEFLRHPHYRVVCVSEELSLLYVLKHLTA